MPAVTPGLSFWRAMEMTQATTAVANTVPGGSAIGIGMTYSMLESWDNSRSRATTAVLVSGVWNSSSKRALPGAPFRAFRTSARGPYVHLGAQDRRYLAQLRRSQHGDRRTTTSLVNAITSTSPMTVHLSVARRAWWTTT